MKLFVIDNLTQEEICHPLRGKAKPIPKLTHAITIEPSYIFQSWRTPRNADLICKFIVKTAHRQNLMVVIQNLSFRQNGSKCVDYVKVIIFFINFIMILNLTDTFNNF